VSDQTFLRPERQVELIIPPDFYTDYAPELNPLATNVLSYLARHWAPDTPQVRIELTQVAEELRADAFHVLLVLMQLADYKIIEIDNKPITLAIEMLPAERWVNPKGGIGS
jgi:hypothetical protein